MREALKKFGFFSLALIVLFTLYYQFHTLHSETYISEGEYTFTIVNTYRDLDTNVCMTTVRCEELGISAAVYGELPYLYAITRIGEEVSGHAVLMDHGDIPVLRDVTLDLDGYHVMQ